MSALIKQPNRAKVSHASRWATWVSVLWTLPALAFYLLFAIIPMFIALYLSFTRWDGLSAITWVGLTNWISLLSDGVTGHSLVLTVEVMIISWVVQTPLSILLGVFMAG
ncbi:MAG TPA: hypothetical protein VGM01_05385, partial [Ktedonobacteraceae bacterium]